MNILFGALAMAFELKKTATEIQYVINLFENM